MITRVGHVALRVANLKTSVTFAEDVLGLREVHRADGVSYLTCNARHHEHVLIQDHAHPGLDHVGLEVAGEAELDALRSKLVDEGCPIEAAAPEPGISSAVQVIAPGGFVFKVFCGMACDQPLAYPTRGVRPRKFEHVTLKVSDKPAMEDFLVRLLGFRLSDRMGDTMSWLRCSSDHHGIGLVAGEVDELHHYAWGLESLFTVEATGDLLRERQRAFLWGPGRHGPGNNIFCYFDDADGSIVEYDADLQRIDEEYAHVVGDWADEPLSINQWGPAPPEGFLARGTPLAQAPVAALR